MADLSRFLGEASARPFAWGDDCLMWLADWLVEQGKPDPAADLRGRYATALGAQRIIRREGGVGAFVERRALSVGLAPTITPKAGDVGLVNGRSPDGRENWVGAICTGPRWAVRSPGGVMCAPTQPAMAWGV